MPTGVEPNMRQMIWRENHPKLRALHAQFFAPMKSASPMVVPWGYFLDAKNHKPPTFSRKIRGLRFQNVAVKERFELSIQFPVYTLSRRAP